MSGVLFGPLVGVREPRWPDERVFGPPLPDHAALREHPSFTYGPVTCKCGAGWDGPAWSRCWACGGTGELG